MNSLILITLVLAVAIYSAIKKSISKSNDLNRKINEHSILFPDRSDQYIWKDYNPLSKEEFKEAFHNEDLSEKWGFFEKHLKPEIRIKPQHVDESKLNIGQSKIGGHPDLPDNIDWPKEKNGKHLEFLAQINFEELKNDNLDIPNQGILYFFYSEDQEFWGYPKENSDCFRTIFVSKPLNLKRRDTPNTLEKLTDEYFKSCKLEFSNSYSLPNREHDFAGNMLNNKEDYAYSDISSSGGYLTKLFGHSTNVQGTMEFECEMVDRGYNWDTIPANEKQDIEDKQYQWKLLFQLDSEEQAQMMWGDAGLLYFWIKEEHLKSHQYEKTWMILQCH